MQRLREDGVFFPLDTI